MSLEWIVSSIRWLGGLLAYSILGFLLYGIWRGTRREAGRLSGRTGAWFHSPAFYLAGSVIYLGISWLGWVPLPLHFPSFTRIVMLTIGSLFYFPGLIFLLRSRLELGDNYFVSTSWGAQIFKDQPLFTTGPYAIVRHPMYTGLILAAVGSLLIYFTWTTVLFAVIAPCILMRARREEAVLLAEFGEVWQEYCKRVPPFFPRISRWGSDANV